MGTFRFAIVGLALVGCGSSPGPQPTDEPAGESSRAEAPQDRIDRVPNERPLVAIWRDSDGHVVDSAAPYLRVAIWADGRVLREKNVGVWGRELVGGRIPAERLLRLKNSLDRSGVFELKGHCYLGPDLPVDCIMIDTGKGKQMLYWCEGMNEWMREPHQHAFVSAWRAVNDLTIAARPDELYPVADDFRRPPASWYLKRMIQSE